MKCPIQKVRALDETIDCNACGEFTCELRYGAGTLAGGGLLGTFARSDKGTGLHRIKCAQCGKPCSSPLPANVVIGATVICDSCVEKSDGKLAVMPEDAIHFEDIQLSIFAMGDDDDGPWVRVDIENAAGEAIIAQTIRPKFDDVVEDSLRLSAAHITVLWRIHDAQDAGGRGTWVGSDGITEEDFAALAKHGLVYQRTGYVRLKADGHAWIRDHPNTRP